VTFDKEVLKKDIVSTLAAVLAKVKIATESATLEAVANVSIKLVESHTDEETLKDALEVELDSKVFYRYIHSTTLERYGDIVMSVFQRHQVIRDTADYCWW
jgi:hypothetical protein